MHEHYRDYLEGTFIPDITISRREDNGHYTARFQSLEATHWDQAEAVNRLNEKIHSALLEGKLTPYED